MKSLNDEDIIREIRDILSPLEIAEEQIVNIIKERIKV